MLGFDGRGRTAASATAGRAATHANQDRTLRSVRERLSDSADLTLDRFNACYAMRRGAGLSPEQAMLLAAADVAAEERMNRAPLAQTPRAIRVRSS